MPCCFTYLALDTPSVSRTVPNGPVESRIAPCNERVQSIRYHGVNVLIAYLLVVCSPSASSVNSAPTLILSQRARTSTSSTISEQILPQSHTREGSSEKEASPEYEIVPHMNRSFCLMRSNMSHWSRKPVSSTLCLGIRIQRGKRRRSILCVVVRA